MSASCLDHHWCHRACRLPGAIYLWRRATVEQTAAIFLAAQRCSALLGIGWVPARRSDAPVCARPPVGATTIRSRPPLGGPAFHRAGHYLPPSLPTPWANWPWSA